MRKQGRGGWGRLVKVGGGDFVAPRGDDRVGDLLKRHGPPQCSSERGLSACGLWHAAYGCNARLRAIEQDRPMLQECASLPDLGRADQLALPDEYLAADGSRKAGARADGRTGRRAGEGERRIDTQRLEGRGEPGVNRAVGFAQAAERRDRGGHRVGHLMLVPYGPAARGASHHVEPPLCEGRSVVAGGGRLVPAQREARRVEAIEAQQRAAGAIGFLEQPLVERHVLRARTTLRLDEQMPGDCWGGGTDSGTGGQ